MEDLISPQIKDSCKLALPNGLKELMSDITREVLRYQPRDLYKFIADYLSALLITRDNLSIASYICNDIANCDCEPELNTELKEIGLPEDDIKTARDIIVNYFEKGEVDEGNLLMKLINDIKIDQELLPAVQDVIRLAYLRHQAHNTTTYESSSDNEQNDIMCAAKHTLDLYRKTAPNEETYGIMAAKIQKTYRAYGVRRDAALKKENKTPFDKSVTLRDPQLRAQMSDSYDIAFPETTSHSDEVKSVESSLEEPELQILASENNKRISTTSSSSLAGSFMSLPSRRPYYAYDCDTLSRLEELPEREHTHIDYTAYNPHITPSTDMEDKLIYKKDDKKISFNEAAKKMGLYFDDDSDSNSNLNESLIETDSDTLNQGDVMEVESNNDDDTEIEQNNVNVD